MANINYSLSLHLSQALIKKNMKLVIAESCTGGGLAEEITAVEGCSAWFDRGFVTYSNIAKVQELDVSEKTLAKHGAVSDETAMEMAKGALEHSDADISLSITGIAGPGGGTAEKPVGMVWFGLADKTGRCEARMGMFASGRKNVRSNAIQFALQWLLDTTNGYLNPL